MCRHRSLGVCFPAARQRGRGPCLLHVWLGAGGGLSGARSCSRYRFPVGFCHLLSLGAWWGKCCGAAVKAEGVEAVQGWAAPTLGCCFPDLWSSRGHTAPASHSFPCACSFHAVTAVRLPPKAVLSPHTFGVCCVTQFRGFSFPKHEPFLTRSVGELVSPAD